MNKFFLSLLLFPVFCFAQNNAKPSIHYSIYATLNSEEKTITAYEKIVYKNNASQPQDFVWIRLYPNAYANDRTAYSDYLLKQNDLRFYFAKEEQRGYINQLDFKQNDISLKTAFDSTKNDLIKVYLQNPLQPGDSTEVTTPFFVKIPYNFSGFGYDNDDGIQLTHWYPEVAYRDEGGWDLKPVTSYYSGFRSNDASFDMKIITDRNNYQTSTTVINKTSQENKTLYEFHLNNSSDVFFSNSLNSIVQTDLPSEEEQNFNKLVPNFLSGKRPYNPNETQNLINQKMHGIDTPLHKSLKPAFLFNLKETDKYNYLSFLPAIGFNNYDKLMVGAMIHNYQLPLNKFNFLLAPMYATNSKTLAGVGRLEYNIWNKNSWWKFAVSGEQYSTGELAPSETIITQDQKPLYYQMRRITPSISYTKYYDDERHKKWSFLLRTFFLKEENYATKPLTDSTNFFYKAARNTAITEFQTTFSNDRALYPYNANLKIDGDKDFLRIGFTGNGFLNYDASGKGLNVRVFAGKFFYMNNDARYGMTNYYLSPYFFSLSSKATQDFTYSDYFIGRSETTGWMSQQIAQSDGFFKISVPYASYQGIGVSDNWIAALNFTADIPDNINPFSKLPFRMPIRAFLDVGTYSGAWTDGYNAPSGKYLYDAGLQVSFFRDALTVYFPLLYSKVFRDAYKSVYPAKRFVHTISFSIDLANLKPKALNKILPL